MDRTSGEETDNEIDLDNQEKLQAIKQKFERNKLNTPLFDTQKFTNHIETAYVQMYERHLAELPPDHIYIEA